MKKLLCILIVVLIVLVISGCKESDGSRFKKEYESLNNSKINGTDLKYLNLSIPLNNKVIYKIDSEIIDVIKNETGVVYFGFNSCPWCRSMIINLLEVVNNLGIEHLYYVDIKDIRDVLEVEENGNIVRTKTGSIAYHELLTLLDDYLDYYVIYDKDNNEIETKEKRIYAPNVVVFKEGKVLGLTTGVSEDLENPFKELTSDMKKQSYDMLYKLIEKIKPNNTCSDHGC